MKITLALFVSSILLISSTTVQNSEETDAIDVKVVVKHLEKTFIGKMRKSSHLAKGHFMETIMMEDTYKGYFESIGYAIYMGEHNGNVAPYTKYKYFCENTKAKIASAPSTTSTLRESLRLRYYGPFSSNKFNYKLSESDPNKDYFILKCTNKKVANSNFSDVFVKVSKEDLNVLEINYTTPTLFSTISNDRLKGDVRIKYTYIDGEPFVSNIETQYKKGKLIHHTTFEILEQKLETFELSKDEFWAFNAIARFPYIKYEASQWEELQIAVPDDYEKIQRDLYGLDVPINQFFVDNQAKLSPVSPIVNQKGHLEMAQNKMDNLKSLFN
ncbi:MAG: hypothetical protein ACFHWX_14595 [Bacteroidota bacterium]